MSPTGKHVQGYLAYPAEINKKTPVDNLEQGAAWMKEELMIFLLQEFW